MAPDHSTASVGSRRRPGRGLLAAAAILALGAAALSGDGWAQTKPQSGTVSIHQVQIAFIFSGNLGSGQLSYQGRTYPFTIGGLVVGGIGVSTVDATGEVYGLERLEHFQGVYGQARYGVAVANADRGGGELWLENPNGVQMHLKSKREGLALSLGADGIYIQFK